MNSVPSNLWEWLAPIQPDERFALTVTTVVIGLAATVLTVGIVSWLVGHIHRLRYENTLKRELLDRGMSADEIATVINAGQKKRSSVHIGRGGFRACG